MAPRIPPPTLPERTILLRLRVPRNGKWHLAGLVAAGSGLALPQASAVVLHGCCQVDGEPLLRPDAILAPGQLLVVRFLPVPAGIAPRIVYQDNAVVVVDKPAGIPVQATSQGAGSVLVERLRQLGVGGRLHVVHRLDQPVSGLLVLGRSKMAATQLTQAFEARTIRKHYLAIPEITPEGSVWLAGGASGLTIDVPLLWVSHLRRALCSPEGKESRTEVVWHRLPWLLLRLHSGRSHQIRAHLSHVGLPLRGDRRYGGPGQGGRIALHSFSLTFPHPDSGELCHFMAPPPEDFLHLSNANWNETLAGDLALIVG